MDDKDREISRLRNVLKSIVNNFTVQKVDNVDQILSDEPNPYPKTCECCRKLWDFYQENDQRHHVLCPVGIAKNGLTNGPTLEEDWMMTDEHK